MKGQCIHNTSRFRDWCFCLESNKFTSSACIPQCIFQDRKETWDKRVSLGQLVLPAQRDHGAIKVS